MAAPDAAAWMSRSNRLSGSNGTSQGLTAIPLAPRACAHSRPAFTPDSGPAGSPEASCSTVSPSARARASASVPGRALIATSGQLRASRVAAHMSNGLPANPATAFSPPKRVERPPAITTPTICPDNERCCSGCELMIYDTGALDRALASSALESRYPTATASRTGEIRAAQNLNSGILPAGSNAGLVNRLAAASA